MAEVISYSHLTIASIPEDHWDEAWLALNSWKGYLQSFPGHKSTRISARMLDNEDIRLFVSTVWDYPEQLEEWRESEFSAESLLKAVNPDIYDIVVETLEDFST